jgi:hypothetical protein
MCLYVYRMHGREYKFLLNDYEDIRNMIPKEKINNKYKVSLLIFKYIVYLNTIICIYRLEKRNNLNLIY